MPARTRRAIIHIGTEKTGSTSIQASLRAIRNSLPERGFAYPSSPGSPNHIRLAVYAAPKVAADRNLGRREALRRGHEGPLEEWLPAQLAQEMAQLPDTVHSVIFSNEHLHSRVRTLDAVIRLKQLLDPFFAEYTIVMYLRRQDELAVSRHSTRIKTGGVLPEILPADDGKPDLYYDYGALVDRWSAVFGANALRPRLFQRSELVGGDVVRDLLQLCGLDGVEVPQARANRNLTLSALAEEFVRHLNGKLPREAGAPPRRLLRTVAALAPGAPLLPERSAVEAFYARYLSGNEQVRRRYFPDRPALFSADFSRYPEQTPRVEWSELLQLGRSLRGKLAESRGERWQKTRTLEMDMQAVKTLVQELRTKRGVPATSESDQAELDAEVD